MDQNQLSTIRKSETQNDGNAVSVGFRLLKTLDANKYATKKTIAQGLLDVALLTANASQLKYVLQVGQQHEFYTLMLSLIIVSIVLQVVVGVLCLSFTLVRDCRLHLKEYHYSANILNHLTTAVSFLITAINLIISVFDPSVARYAVFEAPDVVSAALLVVVMAILKMHQDPKQNLITNILNHVALALVTGALFCDVIKMNFGLDPAVAAVLAIVCIILGSTLDINKEKDQDSANKANNAVLIINVIIVIVNILVNAFQMRMDTNNLSEDKG